MSTKMSVQQALIAGTAMWKPRNPFRNSKLLKAEKRRPQLPECCSHLRHSIFYFKIQERHLYYVLPEHLIDSRRDLANGFWLLRSSRWDKNTCTTRIPILLTKWSGSTTFCMYGSRSPRTTDTPETDLFINCFIFCSFTASFTNGHLWESLLLTVLRQIIS